MQPLTNYRMGTGLAAAIMGSQAGLEQEKMGLENLYKGMQMPGEILKGEEQAALLNDSTYLQQKTANTLIELKNTYSAQDFQQTLDAANRVRIKLDAAAGDPVKEQQVVQESLAALKIDPNSQFGQYAMKDPRGALTKFIEGVEVSLAGTGGAKQAGAKELTMIKEAGDTERAAADRAMRLRIAQLQEGGANARHAGTLSTDKQLNEMISRANNGDVTAQRWINTYVSTKRAANPAFGGMTLSPQGGLQTKGEATQLPFPNAGTLQQPAGGAPTERPPLESFNKSRS